MPLASVSAHEFFHLWNVKRIRPQSLEPIDYQRENDTRALWFSEGVTSTVGDMLLARSGLIDEHGLPAAGRVRDHRIAAASGASLAIGGRVEPGRVVRGQSRSIVRRERSISYYNKGEILGILLDLRIRAADQGQQVAARFVSLDERRITPSSIAISRIQPACETGGRDGHRSKFCRVLSRLCGRGEGTALRRLLPVCRTACGGEHQPRGAAAGFTHDGQPWRPAGSRPGRAQQRRAAGRDSSPATALQR